MENKEYVLKLIYPGEIEGCNIGGILAIPKGKLLTDKMIVMFKEEKYNSIMKVGNNGETKKVKTFEESVERLEQDENISTMPDILGIKGQIVLVPMLPNKSLIQEEGKSEGDFSAEFLSRECFTNINEDSRFYRLDEQISKMIQTVTKEYGLEDKINLFGHSTSGLSAMRFAMIQPNLIDNLIIGGNADEIPTPVGEYGKVLDYPFGIKDFKELFGKEFDEKSFGDISFRFYVGEYEYVDPNLDGIRTENYGIRRDGKPGSGENFAPVEIAKKYKDIFNNRYREDDELSVFERFSNVIDNYEKNSLDVRVLVYEKDCHGPILSTDLKNAQFDKGTAFSSNASQIIKQYLNKAVCIKQFVESNKNLEEVKDYIKASQKIKYNKQEGDVETRIEALKKVDRVAFKQIDNQEGYKEFLQEIGLSPLAVKTLTQLREENEQELGNLQISFFDIASGIVPEASAEIKQNMKRIEDGQLRKDKEERIGQTKE